MCGEGGREEKVKRREEAWGRGRVHDVVSRKKEGKERREGEDGESIGKEGDRCVKEDERMRKGKRMDS